MKGDQLILQMQFLTAPLSNRIVKHYHFKTSHVDIFYKTVEKKEWKMNLNPKSWHLSSLYSKAA